MQSDIDSLCRRILLVESDRVITTRAVRYVAGDPQFFKHLLADEEKDYRRVRDVIYSHLKECAENLVGGWTISPKQGDPREILLGQRVCPRKLHDLELDAYFEQGAVIARAVWSLKQEAGVTIPAVPTDGESPRLELVAVTEPSAETGASEENSAHLPPRTRWGEVLIRYFVHRSCMEVECRERTYQVGAADFAPDRRGRRSKTSNTRVGKLWSVLGEFAQRCGYITGPHHPVTEKDVSRLSKRLKEHFGITEEPIKWDYPDKKRSEFGCYRANFRIEYGIAESEDAQKEPETSLDLPSGTIWAGKTWADISITYYTLLGLMAVKCGELPRRNIKESEFAPIRRAGENSWLVLGKLAVRNGEISSQETEVTPEEISILSKRLGEYFGIEGVPIRFDGQTFITSFRIGLSLTNRNDREWKKRWTASYDDNIDYAKQDRRRTGAAQPFDQDSENDAEATDFELMPEDASGIGLQAGSRKAHGLQLRIRVFMHDLLGVRYSWPQAKAALYDKAFFRSKDLNLELDSFYLVQARVE